jgi:hypothetical protein
MIRSVAFAAVASLFVTLAAGCSSAEGTAGDDTSAAAVDISALTVQPYAKLGTGIEGFGESDINTPDGVIFNSKGNLLLTDAMNHRVQVYDVRGAPRRLGQFGTPDIFHGEVVDLAEAPNGQVIVTDETAHVAYMFDPPTGKEKGDLAFTDYKFTGTDMFTKEMIGKVGGVTTDSKGRIYTVDARKSLVKRYLGDGTPDPTFLFEKNGGGQYLHGCEGVAVDEKRGNLYVASEQDSIVQVFSLEDGTYKNQMIGGHPDAAHPGIQAGTRLFPAAVEGLWILDDYLLASDEADGGVGHVKIFDLREETAFDHGADDYAALKKDKKKSGYVGSFGSFCSPDSVTAFTDATDGESYVAVADQCHYQVVVYKWSDIVKAAKLTRRAPSGDAGPDAP